jgi:uncharacterized protein (DUF302 family)
MNYALSTTVDLPYSATIGKVRDALASQGFGILTEIDLQATLKKKLGVDVAPQVILGACNPPLAHAALEAEPSIGLLLPCNVVVRSTSDDTTIVEAVDPQTMVALTANPALQQVADDASRRLNAALNRLTADPTIGDPDGSA